MSEELSRLLDMATAWDLYSLSPAPERRPKRPGKAHQRRAAWQTQHDEWRRSRRAGKKLERRLRARLLEYVRLRHVDPYADLRFAVLDELPERLWDARQGSVSPWDCLEGPERGEPGTVVFRVRAPLTAVMVEDAFYRSRRVL